MQGVGTLYRKLRKRTAWEDRHAYRVATQIACPGRLIGGCGAGRQSIAVLGRDGP